MKIIIALLGLCVLYVQGASVAHKYIPAHLARSYPNHPYFHLNLRSLTRADDSNGFIEEANKELAAKLRDAVTKTSTATTEIVESANVKSALITQTARDKWTDIVQKLNGELEGWSEESEQGKQCVDQHEEEKNGIIESGVQTVSQCNSKTVEHQERIEQALEAEFAICNGHIETLLALYQSCLEANPENDQQIIECNFHKSLELSEQTHISLSKAETIANEETPDLAKDEYSCSLMSVYDSQLSIATLKQTIWGCINPKK